MARPRSKKQKNTDGPSNADTVVANDAIDPALHAYPGALPALSPGLVDSGPADSNPANGDDNQASCAALVDGNADAHTGSAGPVNGTEKAYVAPKPAGSTAAGWREQLGLASTQPIANASASDISMTNGDAAAGVVDETEKTHDPVDETVQEHPHKRKKASRACDRCHNDHRSIQPPTIMEGKASKEAETAESILGGRFQEISNLELDSSDDGRGIDHSDDDGFSHVGAPSDTETRSQSPCDKASKDPDNDEPCSRCLARGQQCHTTKPQHQRGPVKGFVDELRGTINKQAKELESQAKRLTRVEAVMQGLQNDNAKLRGAMNLPALANMVPSSPINGSAATAKPANQLNVTAATGETATFPSPYAAVSSGGATLVPAGTVAGMALPKNLGHWKDEEGKNWRYWCSHCTARFKVRGELMDHYKLYPDHDV